MRCSLSYLLTISPSCFYVNHLIEIRNLILRGYILVVVCEMVSAEDLSRKEFVWIDNFAIFEKTSVLAYMRYFIREFSVSKMCFQRLKVV